jgi:uncharacterized membrane protein
MICAIGLGLLGLFALRRAHRRCRGYHGCGGYGWHGGWHGGCHGGPGGGDWHGPWGNHGRRSWMVHAALARLDATPAQERAIVAELDKLKDRVRGVKSSLKDARGDLSAAVRGASLDDAALGAVLGRADSAHAEIRTAVIEALRAIHAVLDDKQRAELADLLDRGGGGWWRGGPYR